MRRIAHPIARIAVAIGLCWAMAAMPEARATTREAEAGTDGTPLSRLAAPGPWPEISGLIAYNGAIWFANGDADAALNAADIYSYDPANGLARYERGLFTQGVGAPTVYGGRLYWPYADPRSNAAVGEFALTDGENWQWRIMSEAIALHAPAMAACGDVVMAVSDGWEAALQASSDGVNKWREVYRLPNNKNGENRIGALTPFGASCAFSVIGSQPGTERIYQWTAEGPTALKGWPEGAGAVELTVFLGDLIGFDNSGAAPTLWRHDGQRARRLPVPPQGDLKDIAGAASQFVAITTDSQGGALWTSKNARDWVRLQGFVGETPVDLLTVGDDIYVGTRAANGRGVLWGPKQPARTRPGPAARPLVNPPRTPITEQALEASLRTLEPTLSMKSDYMTFRSGLFSIALPVALTRDHMVGHFLAKRARRPLPAGQMETFTNHVYSNEQLSRWLLLYMAAINGFGYLPVEWLTLPWNAKPRESEKYFETLVLAIWAVARFGQKDLPTIEALIALLDRAGDPPWIHGDAVASLTALTGQHFGHDTAAWRNWWQKARNTWAQNNGQ